MATSVPHLTYRVEGSEVTEWAIIIPPGTVDTIVAKKTSIREEGKPCVWGKWKETPLPENFEGFATSNARYSLSKKQKLFWRRAAARHGLDREASEDLTARQFQILPVLSDLRKKMP